MTRIRLLYPPYELREWIGRKGVIRVRRDKRRPRPLPRRRAVIFGIGFYGRAKRQRDHTQSGSLYWVALPKWLG